MSQLDDVGVIQQFIQGEPQLLANRNLRVEFAFDSAQLLTKTSGLVATAKLVGQIRSVLVRHASTYSEQLNQVLVANQYLPVGTDTKGFMQYQHRPIPEGYAANYTEVRHLWKTWRMFFCIKRNPQRPSLMILASEQWQPVEEISFGQDHFFVTTPKDEVMLYADDRLIWLHPVELNVQVVIAHAQQEKG